jgi:hypothetical protein
MQKRILLFVYRILVAVVPKIPAVNFAVVTQETPRIGEAGNHPLKARLAMPHFIFTMRQGNLVTPREMTG